VEDLHRFPIVPDRLIRSTVDRYPHNRQNVRFSLVVLATESMSRYSVLITGIGKITSRGVAGANAPDFAGFAGLVELEPATLVLSSQAGPRPNERYE